MFFKIVVGLQDPWKSQGEKTRKSLFLFFW
jgi:hypothetical protein